MCTAKSFYSTSDLYNHQFSLVNIHPYTQGLLADRNTTKDYQMQECFLHKSNDLFRVREGEKGG